jgi:hypothetical protein
MDCYFGNGMDEFCVSEGHEDRLPSPGSWSHWGVTSSENFNEGSIEQLENDEKHFFDEVEMPTSGSCGGLLDESSQQTSNSCGRSSAANQFGFARDMEIDDDNYLNSLMDDSENENLYKLFCHSPEFSVLPSADQSIDTSLNSESNKHDTRTQKHSKKTGSYSQSMSWGCEEASASRSSSLYSEQKERPPGKLENFLAPSECNISNGPVSEETHKRSFEESIFQELETVMAKLTNKTRISFRDGFYRLAKSSKRTAMNQNGDFSTECPSPSQRSRDEQLSYEKKQATEVESNTIDRAIANLMFNKMDINMAVFPMEDSHNDMSDHEASDQSNYYGSDKQQQTQRYHLSPTSTSSSEVEFFNNESPRQVSNQPAYFSSTYAGNM